MASAGGILSSGYRWVEERGIIVMASTIAKISALTVATLAVGCAVVAIYTGSWPVLTTTILWKGSIDLVMGITNLLCSVRLIQKIVQSNFQASWKDILGLATTLFVTNYLGLYISCSEFSLQALRWAYKCTSWQIGFITNIAMSVRIFSTVKRALCHQETFTNVIKELFVGTITTLGINALVNRICFYGFFDLHDLSCISASFIGFGIIAALIEKIASIVRRTIVNP